MEKKYVDELRADLYRVARAQNVCLGWFRTAVKNEGGTYTLLLHKQEQTEVLTEVAKVFKSRHTALTVGEIAEQLFFLVNDAVSAQDLRLVLETSSNVPSSLT